MIKDTSAQDRPKTKTGSRKPLLFGGLTLIAMTIMGLGLFTSQADRSISATGLRTATVYQGRFERSVNATGRVIATHSPSLYSVATGRVTFLKYPGETVALDELVASIHSPDLVSLFEQQQSALAFSKIALQRQHLTARQDKLTLKKAQDLSRVNLIAADRELQRAEISYKLQVISLVDYETAKDNQLKAKLELENAILETEIKTEIIDFELKSQALELDKQHIVLKNFQRRVDQLKLRSPVAGIIGNWLVEQDDKVIENTPLLTVVDLSAFAGELDIPQSFADDLAIGMMVNVRIGGQKLEARLSSVSPEVRDNSVKARLEFVGQLPEKLRQNQNLSAKILLEARDDILQVSRGPFLQAGDFAFVIKEGIAEKQAITIGSRSLDRIEVLSGLFEGDEIIISSVDKFNQENAIYIN